MDGFSVDLSSNIVPDFWPRGVKERFAPHDPQAGIPGCRACFRRDLSPIGVRVPTRLYDTRGASFNPGSLAQLIMPDAPITLPTSTVSLPMPKGGGGGNGNGNGETFFKNADGTLKTGRVVVALVAGGIVAGLAIRQLRR